MSAGRATGRRLSLQPATLGLLLRADSPSCAPRRTDQLNVNFLGAVSVTRALLPQIEASKGAIVCVNSFGGVMPLYNMTAYTASKYALAGGTPALRIRHAMPWRCVMSQSS